MTVGFQVLSMGIGDDLRDRLSEEVEGDEIRYGTGASFNDALEEAERKLPEGVGTKDADQAKARSGDEKIVALGYEDPNSGVSGGGAYEPAGLSEESLEPDPEF